MSDRDAFIRAIAANLYDDTPRLAFADWLDEHGEHDRAEFIRVQCELEPMRDRYEIPRAAELHDREDELERGGGRGEFDERKLPGGTWEAPDRRPDTRCEFRRGFPDILRVNARRFVSDGHALREKVPTLRRLVVHCLNGWGERLAGCAAVRGVPELELACWYSDADIRALAASPHLSELKVLVLWLGRWPDAAGADETLCRIAAAAEAWPNLRELVLLDPEGNDRESIEALAASANRLLTRPVARYQRGYPELFPLNREVRGSEFPVAGHLGDGRPAVANARARFTLTAYDADGEPAEVIEIPLPPDLYKDKATSDTFWRTGYKQLLRDAYGFTPGFIRIQAGTFTDDEDGPHRGNEYDWDHCGEPDRPDGAGDPDRDQGYGGAIYRLIRQGEFELGYCAWADNRGQVHST